MPSAITILTLFSSLSFIFYGLSCLTSKRMAIEFGRFGLTPKQRDITGILQLTGGLGLGIGYYLFTPLADFSAFGLSLLMFLGFIVRLKIKDSVIASAPALMYALLNLYLGLRFFEII
ncbi:MAG: DoxX family protein [Psychroserpens sp.]|uniref:DoxX family protein n=1 Tax=Psychroserpens sp. TaxID=2020870 RepID=UPI003C796B88